MYESNASLWLRSIYLSVYICIWKWKKLHVLHLTSIYTDKNRVNYILSLFIYIFNFWIISWFEFSFPDYWYFITFLVLKSLYVDYERIPCINSSALPFEDILMLPFSMWCLKCPPINYIIKAGVSIGLFHHYSNFGYLERNTNELENWHNLCHRPLVREHFVSFSGPVVISYVFESKGIFSLYCFIVQIFTICLKLNIY